MQDRIGNQSSFKAWIYRTTTKYMSRLTDTFWGDYHVVLSSFTRHTNVAVSLIKDAFVQWKDQCSPGGLGLHYAIAKIFLIRLCNILLFIRILVYIVLYQCYQKLKYFLKFPESFYQFIHSFLQNFSRISKQISSTIQFQILLS